MHKLLIVATCIVSLAFTPLVVFSTPVNATGPLLVIFPPWKDIDAAISLAGAAEVAPLRAPFAALVVAPTLSIQAALKEHGAWTFLDGALVAQLCGA